MLPGQAGHEVGRNRGGVREGLVEAGQHLVEDLQVARLHQQLVMLGAELLRDLARVRKLVVAVLSKADRERLDGQAGSPGHDRHHGAGIEAAAEERADRDIAHQVRPHGVLEPRPEALGRLGLLRERRAAVTEERGRLPVTARLARPAVLGSARCDPARSLATPSQDGPRDRARNRAADTRRGPVAIEPSRQPGALEQRLQLRAEEQALRGGRVVQGLDPEPIARQEQTLRGARPRWRTRTSRGAARRSARRAPRRGAAGPRCPRRSRSDGPRARRSAVSSR